MVIGSSSDWASSTARYLSRDPALWIGGARVAASGGEVFDAIDPATGGRIALAARGTVSDIDRAVDAARTAFESSAWRDLSPGARAQVLWRYAEVLEKNAQELAELEVLNNGMLLGFAQWSVSASAAWLRHYAGLAGRLIGRHTSAAISGDGQRFHAYTASEPIGVVGLITPWNGPIAGFMIKVAPALAAGCTCVVKPSENTPLTALRLAELASEAGVPDGVVNVVTGFGDVGAALAAHDGVDKISFTGSTETGKSVLRAAADRVKRTTLELGGKSPCIVFADADIDLAIRGAAQAIFANAGQVCFAGSRLYVERAAYDRVIEGVAEVARSLRVGGGLDAGVEVGPLISDRHRQRVVDYIAMGREDGGEVVAGGNSIDRDGYFIEPTVFSGLPSAARIVREEIFGPVVVAAPFDDLDEVAAMGNDTNYGLGAGVFTSNLSKAHSLAARLRAGNIWVNCYGVTHPEMPFGGFKESGLGREFGEEGFAAFLEAKSVFVALAGV